MAARRRKHPQGRRTRLMEPGVHKTLVDRTKLGLPGGLAAMAAGISERTFLDWMQRGAAESDRLADLEEAGEESPAIDPYAKPFLLLYRDVMQARAVAASHAMVNLQKSAVGGFITEETTRTFRNADGQKVTETTIKRQPPDWRANSWLLERQFRRDFGRDATQVEITGLPVESATTATDGKLDPASDLAKRITDHLAALTPQITSQVEVIEDAEVVE